MDIWFCKNRQEIFFIFLLTNHIAGMNLAPKVKALLFRQSNEILMITDICNMKNLYSLYERKEVVCLLKISMGLQITPVFVAVG